MISNILEGFLEHLNCCQYSVAQNYTSYKKKYFLPITVPIMNKGYFEQNSMAAQCEILKQ
jgi:hypothetical protein